MYEKNHMLFLLFTCCFGVFTEYEEVRASEEKEGIYVETEGNDDFESAKAVIRSETVTDINNLGDGIMLLNDFDDESFTKTAYINLYDENGYRVTLCALRLGGVAYFYDDGKVHLYSLYSETYIYDDRVYEIVGGYPVIENTDGSSSQESAVFIVNVPEYGINGYQMWVRLTRDSRTITSELVELYHQEP